MGTQKEWERFTRRRVEETVDYKKSRRTKIRGHPLGVRLSWGIPRKGRPGIWVERSRVSRNHETTTMSILSSTTQPSPGTTLQVGGASTTGGPLFTSPASPSTTWDGDHPRERDPTEEGENMTDPKPTFYSSTATVTTTPTVTWGREGRKTLLSDQRQVSLFLVSIVKVFATV